MALLDTTSPLAPLREKVEAGERLDLESLLEVPRRLGYRVEYRRAERPTPQPA